MISGFQEFRDARRLLQEAAHELENEGVPSTAVWSLAS